MTIQFNKEKCVRYFSDCNRYCVMQSLNEDDNYSCSVWYNEDGERNSVTDFKNVETTEIYYCDDIQEAFDECEKHQRAIEKEKEPSAFERYMTATTAGDMEAAAKAYDDMQAEEATQ